MIVKVPPEDLHIIWNEVEPQIKKALDDCYTAQDILDGLIQKRFQLFISWEDKVESAVITEIAQYPRKRILRYFLLSLSVIAKPTIPAPIIVTLNLRLNFV